MKTVKRVAIALDRERYLRYDVNALIALGDALDINLMTREGWEVLVGKSETDPASGETKFVPAETNFKKVRAIIWAGLIHEDESLTLQQVGAMLNPAELGPVVSAYMEAWRDDEVAEKHDPLADRRPASGANAAVLN